MIWKTWKKGFDAWEASTAKYAEEVLRSSAVLWPAGKMLTATMKTRAAVDDAAAKWWASMGLSPRRDQERTLHALNQLQSRILDLEERLEDATRAPKN